MITTDNVQRSGACAETRSHVELTTITYELAAPKIARVTLNRPESRNAQDTTMLYELNAAFDRAAQDDDVSVIVLAARGPHFSAGHDLRERGVRASMNAQQTVGTWCGFGCEGAEAQMAREKEMYLGFSERWRNLPKPMLAEVQGKVIAGGLMLVWPCDIIIAADNAEFIDNTVAMGVCGAEFFQHPWELGVRKAKEMLFTSDVVSAQEALALGMVNRVVPLDLLTETTMDLAARIAERPLFALKLTKEAVNAAQDAQGRVSAMQTSFALHQLCHAHNRLVHGSPIDPSFMTTTYGRAISR
jgi:enoyl-CoA hydratase